MTPSAHNLRVVCVWFAVDLRFAWFRAVLEARNHRFAARTGFGCDCGEYERGLKLERRPSPCPNRKWHRSSVSAYLRDARFYRRRMRRQEPHSFPFLVSCVPLETQAEWMVAGGPPFLALGQPDRSAAA